MHLHRKLLFFPYIKRVDMHFDLCLRTSIPFNPRENSWHPTNLKYMFYEDYESR